jgi:predicted lactoylglutathione lyase
MAKMIFLNLPVSDVARATAFYEAIGAVKNPQFSNETASCMVLSETIHVMLLSHDMFRTFTPKPVVDARAANEVLICISADSSGEIDAIVDRAAAAGGRADPAPGQDHGWMRSRSFEDPDGHFWEVAWMDMAAAATANGAMADA